MAWILCAPSVEVHAQLSPSESAALGRLAEAARLFAAGDRDGALALASRLVSDEEKRDADSLETSRALNLKGAILLCRGDAKGAVPLLQQAVALVEKRADASPSARIEPLGNLVEATQQSGGAADSLRARYLALVDEAPFPYTSLTAFAVRRRGTFEPIADCFLGPLAGLDLALAQYKWFSGPAAHILADAALVIAEQRLDPSDARHRTSLLLAADERHRAGDYAGAIELSRKLVTALVAAAHSDPRERFDAEWELGAALVDAGQFAGAEPHLIEAERAFERAKLGDVHHLAEVLQHRATVREELGDLEGARKLAVRAAKLDPWFESAVAETDELAGRFNDSVAAWHRIARAQASDLVKGDVISDTAADSVVEEALASWAGAELGAGHADRTLSLLGRAATALEKDLRGAGTNFDDTPATLRTKLQRLSSYVDLAVTAISSTESRRATRLAFELTLRRKGRLLDILAERRHPLRAARDPAVREDLDRLRALQSKLAAATLGHASRGRILTLVVGVDRIERRLLLRGARVKTEKPSASLAAVQSAIREGTALVEFVSYRPVVTAARRPSERRGEVRYGAFVLVGAGEPVWVELGPASAIDPEIDALHRSFSSPSSRDWRERAQAVEKRVFEPLRPFLEGGGGARHILIAPVGPLSFVPFGALRDATDAPLVTKFLFTFLTSGRDLLARAPSVREPSDALVIADPEYASPEPVAVAAASPDRAIDRALDLNRLRWPRLPATRREGEAVHSLVAGSRLFVDAAATKNAISQAMGPRVLHIATHGFFDSDAQLTTASATRAAIPLEPTTPTEKAALSTTTSRAAALGTAVDPLLLSGLVFAPTRILSQRPEPSASLLTALELSGFDLDGTKLAVLSACQTGLGLLDEAEGVYGLRRALAIAGAETQVISLWQVSDAATSDLMTTFYGKLAAGEGRSEALRSAQRAMLADPARAHPYFWASFIASGDPTPMKLSIAAPR